MKDVVQSPDHREVCLDWLQLENNLICKHQVFEKQSKKSTEKMTGASLQPRRKPTRKERSFQIFQSSNKIYECSTKKKADNTIWITTKVFCQANI